MKPPIVAAEELLNEALRSTWIEEVRLSDSWSVRFSNGLWLTAYEIELSEESSVTSALSSVPALLEGTDPGNVPKMTCLCALMRETVARCSIDEGGSLHIAFARGGELRAEVDVPVVDWMWTVAPAPGNPYSSPSIAYCLAARTVEVGTLAHLDRGAKNEA